MINIQKADELEKNYQLMVEVIKSLLETEKDIIANLSNISAVINVYVERINWVGFYILKGDQLVLGPFQGLPACIRINMGSGVCGKAASEGKTIIVEDVHKFDGHIACDSNTNSEIVIPLFKGDKVYGVLDIDSPEFNRFTELESKYLQQVGDLLSDYLASVD